MLKQRLISLITLERPDLMSLSTHYEWENYVSVYDNKLKIQEEIKKCPYINIEDFPFYRVTKYDLYLENDFIIDSDYALNYLSKYVSKNILMRFSRQKILIFQKYITAPH